MSLKKIFILVSIFLSIFNFSNSKEIIIKVIVDDEIITNIDVEIEKSYLLLLNNNLSK